MRKNKICLLALGAVLLGSLAACQPGELETFEYAMVTDVGDVDDQSFNQTSWEATKAFAEKKGASVRYYRPSDDNTPARLASIEQAVNNGAKVIVCPGFMFEEAIFEAQNTYPEVKFVLIDGNPHSADYSKYETTPNATGIVFKEEISGYLAGYAAVKEGKTKLGFVGGMAVPAVQRFGSGFVQGIDEAAKELDVQTSVNYYYAGEFAATDAATANAKSWYAEGTETIFACGGKVYQSVQTAASEKESATWIGVDVDQHSVDSKVLTSATKDLKNAVTSALECYAEGKWDTIGGQNFNLGLDSVLGAVEKKDYVCLPTNDEAWRFKKFTKAEYEETVASLKSGKLTVSGSSEEAPVPSEHTTVNWVSSFAK